MRAYDLDVSAEIDQPVLKPGFRANYRGTIRGVFLDDAAEVELHPCDAERELRSVPVHLAPAHPREQGFQQGGVWQRLATRAPGFAQHARSNVEQAIALLEARRSIVEKRCGLGVDVDRAAGGRRAVDL